MTVCTGVCPTYDPKRHLAFRSTLYAYKVLVLYAYSYAYKYLSGTSTSTLVLVPGTQLAAVASGNRRQFC